MPIFSGVGVALITVFAESGDVDETATAKHAAELAERGMQAILVAGTTGEAGTLTGAERVRLIQAVRSVVPSGIPVLAGTGSQEADVAVDFTAAAVDAGADAVLTFPPPGSSDLQRFYAEISAAAGGRPVLAYHVPWISAPGVPVDALPALPIAGVKDSSGSADRLIDELAHYSGATYVGSSALLVMAGPTGAEGAILALANLEPEDCCLAFAGNASAQLRMADPHLEVREGGPAAIKRILSSRVGVSARSRVA